MRYSVAPRSQNWFHRANRKNDLGYGTLFEKKWSTMAPLCGPTRARTWDPLIMSQVL